MNVSIRLTIGFMILALTVGGCTKAAPVAGAGDNVLRFDVAAPFTTLDPLKESETGSKMIYPLIYSYLFVPDADGRLQPDLAESWTYDDASRTWTINLRDDAFFHDGRPVTAEDVRYALQTKGLKQKRSIFQFITEITVKSEQTVALSLNRHDPRFLQKLWDSEILSSRRTGAGSNDRPVGSGPFVFSSREGERKVVLAANEHYYKGRPSLDGVVFYYQPNREATWVRLLSGDTDVAQEISPQNYEIIRRYQDRFYFNHYTLGYYSILLYNTHDPLFADARVRRALSKAINRRYIVDNILNGCGRVATGPMGIGSPYHNPDVKPQDYDPQAALKALSDLGWKIDIKERLLKKNGQPFAFTLLMGDETQVEKAVARFIQLCFNDIGIQMDMCVRPFKEVIKTYLKNNAFQAVLTEFSGAYRQPEFIIDGWLPDQQGKNQVGNFTHPELTRLLRKALASFDNKAQRQCLVQADALIADLQPGSFLFQKTAFDVMSCRFILRAPFYLTTEGTYWLWQAGLSSS